jgi:hypothetical protein
MRRQSVSDVRPRTRREPVVEAASMEDLLRLHERLFAPLDPEGRARMLRAARLGASRAWRDMDGLAA